jgi:hypothetical protein
MAGVSCTGQSITATSLPASRPNSTSAPTTLSADDVRKRAVAAIAQYCSFASPEDKRKFWEDAVEVGLAKAALEARPIDENYARIIGKRVSASDSLHLHAQQHEFDQLNDVAAFRRDYAYAQLKAICPKISFTQLELKDVFYFIETASAMCVEIDWDVFSRELPVNFNADNITVGELVDGIIKFIGPNQAKWSIDMDSHSDPRIVITTVK